MANNCSRQCPLNRSSDRCEERAHAGVPTDQACLRHRDGHFPVDNTSSDASLCPLLHSSCSVWRDGDCVEGSGGGTGRRGETRADAGEMRVVERLVAGLVEENQLLGSTIKQLQVVTIFWPTDC